MDNRTAWVVLFECFGFDAVKGVKPSTLTASQTGEAADLLAGVIDAYKSDNRITSLLSFHSYTPPGLNGVLFKSARAVIREGQSDKYASITQLPFYDKDFHEWMEKPSFTRGIKMRECMQQLESDPPQGWDEGAAQKAVQRNIGTGGGGLILKMLGIPGA